MRSSPVALVISMFVLAACDTEESAIQTEEGPDGAGGDLQGEREDPPLIAERGHLVYEDELDQALVQPDPPRPLTLLERSDRRRERLVQEGLVASISADADIIEGVQARWFVRGQGVTVQNLHEREVYVSVEFLGDSGCRAVATRRPVEARGSLAIRPGTSECEVNTANMTTFNELGQPIHVESIAKAKPLAARKNRQ